MSPRLREFLQRWIINTFAVAVAASVVHGIHYDTITGLIIASFLLGILNAFLRPLLLLLSLPLLILTLGIFTFFINAFLLYLVGSLMKSFHVDSYSAAFWGGLVISLISLILNSLPGTGNSRITIRRGGPPPRRHDDDGPVINV